MIFHPELFCYDLAVTISGEMADITTIYPSQAQVLGAYNVSTC